MNSTCKECGGKCCTGFFIELGEQLDKDLEKYFRFHKCVLTPDGMFIPLKCSYLKKGRCIIYSSSTKPKFCTEYKCTYLGGKYPVPPIAKKSIR